MNKLQTLLLTRIRLSSYFWFLFVIYFVASYLIKGVKFDPGALTLFSVNSFLYGFYISPILGAQKARIDTLHQIIRSESNALFSMMLTTKKLSEQVRTEIQALITNYVQAKLRSKRLGFGEKEYEQLISYCVSYKGHDADRVETVLKEVVSNQRNRTDFAMQQNNSVYANEWQIMAILFGITLGFVLTLQVSGSLLLHVVRALLCTGLTMLIVILIKLNTLTHKRAKQMWKPLQKLLDTKFYQID